MADEEKKDEENIGSFYMGRVRPPPEPRRFLPPGVLTIIALAALGGIVWYAYPRGAEKYTKVDVPLVKADTAPIKAAPANPGGMEVRHQDSTVFDPLQKNGGAEVEKIMPTPEQPMDKDQAIKAEEIKPIAASPTLPPKLDMQVKDAGNGTEKIEPKAEEVKPPPVAVPPVMEPAKVAAAVPPPKVEVVKPVPRKEEEPAKDYTDYLNADEPADKPAAKPAEVPVAKAKAAPAAKTTAATTSSSPDTKYEIQLGSYREEADGKRDWVRLQKKYADHLGKLKMRLVKADIPGKGTYYRLRAGTVSKDKAHAICDALKADHGVGCILAKQ